MCSQLDKDRNMFAFADNVRYEQVPRRDQQMLEAGKKVIEAGPENFDSHSSFANCMRAELKKDPEKHAKCAGLSAKEAAQFKVDWTKQFVNSTESKHQLLSLGQLVIEQGGWENPQPVSNAL